MDRVISPAVCKSAELFHLIEQGVQIWPHVLHDSGSIVLRKHTARLFRLLQQQLPQIRSLPALTKSVQPLFSAFLRKFLHLADFFGSNSSVGYQNTSVVLSGRLSSNSLSLLSST